MAITILTGPGGENSYTRGLLDHLSKSVHDKDWELVSVCDLADFGVLLRPKRAEFRIVGGQEAFNDQLISYFCDGAVIGEGFDFFRDARDESFWNAEYFARAGEGRLLTPSTRIDWEQCPAVRVGPKKVMVLAERGCSRKCRFCFTSWTTKPAKAPRLPILRGKWLINTITNESASTLLHKVPVRSIRIQDYLKISNEQADMCRKYRIGLEAFTEEGRRKLGKPISDQEVRDTIMLARRRGHELLFFVLGGLEEEGSVEAFIAQIGLEAAVRPLLIIKVTYFNPCLHTPMQAYDIRALANWDAKKLYGRLKSASARTRLVMRSDAGNAIWRGVAHRARSREEFERLWPARNWVRHKIEDFIERENMTALWTDPLPTRVKFWWQRESVIS